MFHGRNEQIRKLHITATQLSKSSKRRKDTRLKQFPNLREASKQGKTPVTKTALNFFDNHYKQVFGPEWQMLKSKELGRQLCIINSRLLILKYLKESVLTTTKYVSCT